MTNKQLVWIIVILVVLVILQKHFKKMAYPTGGCTSTNCVDFGTEAGTIKLHYGSNENDKWETFVNSPTLQQLHRDIKDDYIRMWVTCQGYINPSMPFNGVSYNYNNLDKFVNAVLNSNAIPFVEFAMSYDRCGGQGHGLAPPASDAEFADYIATVVQHFKDKCDSASYSKPCNVNNWYFEIWNEPFHSDWWIGTPPRYSVMFNLVESRIKAIAPNAQVGGYDGIYLSGGSSKATSFLSNSDPDFIAVHHYGNHGDTENIMYNYLIPLSQITDAEIINSEYGNDYGYSEGSNLENPFYASALIWQIKSQVVTIEHFYPGTSAFDDGYGFWGPSGTTWDTYDMRKNFATYNTHGSIIYTNTDSSSFDILAVQSNGKRYITIVNNLGSSNSMSLEILNSNINKLINLETSEEHSVSSSVNLNFDAYEIKFLEVYGPISPDYSYFLSSKVLYLSGGGFATFISGANNWINS